MVQENRALAGEIERRAQEKLETDRMISELTKQTRESGEQVQSVAAGIASATEGVKLLTSKAGEAIIEATNRKKYNQTIGMIAVYQLFSELFLDWREMIKVVSPAGLDAKFTASFVSTLDSATKLVNQVYKEGRILEVADIQRRPRRAAFVEEVD